MLKELKIRKKYIFLLLLRIPFEGIRTVINSYFLKKSFYSIENLDFHQLVIVCLLFFTECILLFLYNGTVWRNFGAMYAVMNGRLKKFMFTKLMKKPLEELEKKSSGDMLVRFNSDADKALAIYGEPFNLVFLLNGFFNFIISSVLLFRVNKLLYVLVIAFVVPHVCLVNFAINPVQYKIQSKIQKVSGELTDIYTSFINMADIAKLYDCTDFLLLKIRLKNKELRYLNIKKALFSALSQAVIPFFGLSGYLILMLAGGNMISNGLITFGTLLYVAQLRGGILPSSLMIIQSWMNINTNRVSLKRVME